LKNRSRSLAYFLFLSLAAIWGTNFFLMKKAVACFTPGDIGFGRLLGGVAVLVAVYWFRRNPWSLSRRDLIPLVLLALFGNAWPFFIQPLLVAKCGSGFIGMMVSFVPLVTIIVSIPMLRVYPSPRQAVGVVGGLLCLMLIMWDGIERQIAIVDLLLAISVPIAYAICNTFIRRRFVGVKPLHLSMCCLALALPMILPLVVVADRNVSSEPGDLTLAIVSLVLLGTLGTGYGALAFTKLLQDEGPLFAGMVTYLVPTIALAWGWIAGETVSLYQIGALVGVLLMVAIVQFGAAGASSEQVRED